MANVGQMRVIGMPVNLENLEACSSAIAEWARKGDSRYICVANAHMAVECSRDEGFATILEESDLVTSDGMPLVWMLRMRGFSGKRRVCARDLVHNTLAIAQSEGFEVGFIGGSQETLDLLISVVREQYGALKISYVESPPFRNATPDEERARVQRIVASDVRILFVGLGCPNQERWMHAHRHKVSAVMLGVGAAFDFLAGTKPVAPKFMQKAGLEWLHRLVSEPKRLWRRYLVTNSRFVALAVRQLVRERLAGR